MDTYPDIPAKNWSGGGVKVPQIHEDVENIVKYIIKTF